VVKNGENFTVGADSMSSPGHGSLAAENVNCGCMAAPVIEES